jgi:Ca2+-transporting ATPase
MEVGKTMAYLIIGLSSVINIANIRSSSESIFTVGFKTNRPLLIAILVSLGLMIATATIPPVMVVFQTVPISLYHWLIVLSLSTAPLVVGELYKLSVRIRRNPAATAVVTT